MKNKLVQAIALNKNVRIIGVDSTELVNQAQISHQTWPTATAALGRTLSVGAMMGSMLKSEKEQLTIQINGDGPLGTVMVTANYLGQVKGYVADPEVMLTYNDTGKLAVGPAIGQGFLRVIKDMNLKNEFSGTVELQSGEIGDDFAYYFNVSEQTPSAVIVGVLVDIDNTVKSSGGLIIQMLPGAKEEDIVKVEDAVNNLEPISDLIDQGQDIEDIIKALFDDVKILHTSSAEFYCDCSKERFEDGLRTLDVKEIEEMIEEGQEIETVCNFCQEKYIFTVDELRDLKDVH